MRRLLVMLLMSLILVGCQTIPQGGGTATDYYNQGRAAYDVGDYNGAVMNFQEAVRLDPGHLDAWNNLGIVRVSAANRRDAAKLLGFVHAQDAVVIRQRHHPDAQAGGVGHQFCGRLRAVRAGGVGLQVDGEGGLVD